MSSPPTSKPTGTVTFLFTEVEGSTKMWERNPSVMQKALSRHDEILRSAIEANGGYVFKTLGDAFCAAFPAAQDALDAALVAQRALADEPWDEGLAIKAKMALHTGTVEERDGDYFGPPVNRVARLLSIANGGQVLLSTSTQELVRDELPSESGLRDLGEHRLKDLFRPERIFQLSAPGLPSEFPPLRTLESRPNNLPMQPTPLVGRERETAEVADRVRIEEARLLTLTGPGGTGKTRLALQVAADLLEEFEDAVFFVALATITDPALVASAIAGPLGVKESGDQPLEEGLKAYLRDRNLLLVLDNFEQAKASSQEALTLYRELGDKRGVAYSLYDIGWVELMQGNDEQAAPLVDESLAMVRESGDEWGISTALNALSAIAGDRGDYERAEASYEEALAGSRELKDTYSVAMALVNLGLVVTRRGDYERTRMLVKESLLLSRQLGSKINIAECLEILSEMAGALGDFRRAARLWGTADALREAINAPWPPLERRLYESYLAAIRSRANEALWRRSWEEGRAMTMEEAFTYALEDTQERA